MAEENKSKGLLGGALELGGKVISAPFKLVGGVVGGFAKLSGKLADKAGRGILGGRGSIQGIGYLWERCRRQIKEQIKNNSCRISA